MATILVKIIVFSLLMGIMLSKPKPLATWDQLEASAKINDMLPYGRSVAVDKEYHKYRDEE